MNRALDDISEEVWSGVGCYEILERRFSSRNAMYVIDILGTTGFCHSEDELWNARRPIVRKNSNGHYASMRQVECPRE